MSTTILPPFPLFLDDAGKPLDRGFVYVGTAGSDPTTSPISLFWDAALTTPASQPLRTVAGYIVNNGVRSQVYSSSTLYSISVRNRNNVVQVSASTNLWRPTIVGGLVIGNSEGITMESGSNLLIEDGAVVNVGTNDGSPAIMLFADNASTEGILAPTTPAELTVGSDTRPLADITSRDASFKRVNIYGSAAPTSQADLAVLRQNLMPCMAVYQTSSTATAAWTASSAYNVNTATSNRTGSVGVYRVDCNHNFVNPYPIAIPATPSDTCSVTTVSLTPTRFQVTVYRDAVGNTDAPFHFICFGNPSATDPIS